MPKLSSPRDLLVHELKDLYSAEQCLVNKCSREHYLAMSWFKFIDEARVTIHFRNDVLRSRLGRRSFRELGWQRSAAAPNLLC
jgi:hypothetical protein